VKQINLRLDDETLDAVDRARGKVPRQKWIEEAVDLKLGRGTRKPATRTETAVHRTNNVMMARQAAMNASRDKGR
jgi:hypothetical protein